MRSTILAIAMLAAYLAAIAFAHARETDCSAAQMRDAMAEYDYVANHMLGIPKDAPIFKVQKSEYVEAVCIHEAFRGR